jgi:hypothetical protein
MRSILILLVVSLPSVLLHATSYHFSLPQKVKACRAILRVTITEARPPTSDSLIEPAICSARVEDVFKGPARMKEVEFRFTPYGDLAPQKLPRLVGQTYLVFLHEIEGRYWVFEGPAGIRPIGRKYHESRIEGQKLVEETYDYEQFVATI